MFRKIRARKPKVLSISTIADLLMVLNNSSDLRSAFTSVLVGLDREHREGFPTMAVTLKNGRYRLIVGDAMEELVSDTDNHTQIGLILVHELMHIVQTHIEQSLDCWLELTEEDDPTILYRNKDWWGKINPLAVDYAVNSICLDTKLFTLQQFNHSAPLREDGFGVFKGVLPSDMNLPQGLSYREYFHILWDIMDNKPPKDWPGMPEASGGGGIEEAQEHIEKMSGGGNPFQHIEDILGEELEGLDPEELEDLIASAASASKDIAKEVTKNLKARGFGSSGICELLEKSLEGPVLDWRSILAEFIQSAREASEDPISTNMKPSLAMLDLVNKSPYKLTAFPGRKKKPVFRVGVFIDTSGSVSSQMLRVFLAEIDGILESGTCVLAIHCDSSISHVEEIEAGDEISSNIYGRGGTDFNPPFAYVIEEGIHLDAILYFTDGEAPLPVEDNRIEVPTLWVVTPECRCPGSWQRVTLDDQLKELEYGSLLIVSDD